MRSRTIRVKAFAKINLSLRIVGVRRDGYHELRTIFQSIALFDTLAVRRRRGPFSLTCDDPACPIDASNLVTRAADAVWKAARRRGAPRGVAVHLAKRIPMQTGLGGGSSDAAAALRLFARLWRVPAARLERIARRLGADVPYFLQGGAALGVARGDRLVPLASPRRAHVVVVVPPFGVSSKDAFGWWDRDRAARPTARVLRVLFNDLEAPVAKRRPEISRIVAELRRMGATHSAMTGSGSAVFGLFETGAGAARAAAVVRKRGRRVETVRTLTRRECRALAAK
jgi:4-diphosphocytidyl-2-C-methyl-D-erythritol kinase